MWFWSSVEDRGGVEEENGGNAHFRLAYSLLFATLVFLGQRYPDKTAFFIGSLHASFASHIPATALDYLSDNYAKLIFTQSALPIPSIHATEDYVFRTIDVADLGDVVATSSIPRAAAVLGRISNTAAYLASSPAAAAQAWCFTSSEGSMSTLFVRPEKRGSGLGKETMRRELEKGFAERRFISAEVSLRNVRSMAVCAGLGAKKMWEVVWVTVKLDEFR
ncbi:hypothetical protein FA95DRAFT_1558177 [Auriscalpium vulgare]|uniref:Uncharacterized protein n=1 Tax=Auriscalpium vulgare TaxID=40419 RepID=A0ACB8RXG4_9AGAM|nr:hypothetical protein FA95DRAFT_1558177 [Auriscalpium vulgare]